MEVAMLHCGESPHPAHQGFADSIGAEWYNLDTFPEQSARGTIPVELFNGLRLDGYDVYIAEGTRSLYGALVNRIGSNSKLIYLAADQVLYQLQHRNDRNRSIVNRLISQYGMPLLKLTFNRYIDGVITISEFASGYTREFLKMPVRIAHPYIQPEVFAQLGQVTPDLEEKVAVTIGSYTWYKGQDILPDVWEYVRREHSNAELHLVGSGYPQKLEKIPGVTVRGYVESIPDVLSDASLYIHPARAEAFGVSVVEALRAGVPALVTSTTGAESVVRSINRGMVAERSVEELANSIIEYFDKPIDHRNSLSLAAREQGSRFDSPSRKATFRDEFNELLARV